MRPFLLLIISIITLFSSCDWVNDDQSGCASGTWLKVSYTYNILDVDAASHIGDITILAFDKNDKYVDRLDVDSVTLHQGYCMVKVPFPEGTYDLLIWGGAGNPQTYQFPYLKTGVTERKSLLLSLLCDNEKQKSGKLNSLFYSSLENITISQDYQVFTASLMKNTNYFSCILQDENYRSLNEEDFSFTLESTNGCMDHTNTPVGTELVIYPSYHKGISTISGQIPVVHAQLNTLRIMKEDKTSLLIKHIPSGKTILRLPITPYLLLSKPYKYLDEASDQEYLDRQDSYTLLFFIQSSESGVPQICSRMEVNGWIIRLNDSELN